MPTYAAKPEEGVAWITGASSGIGRSLALRLAKGGWRVAVTARSDEALESLVDEARGLTGSIMAFPGDITDAEAIGVVVDAVERVMGPVALAVLNAGVYLPVRGNDLDLGAFEQSFAVNLSGTVKSLIPLVSKMKSRGKGQIAIVGSIAGYSGLPTSAAYGATKAGLLNMAEALKFDLDKLGIRLQVVSPGFVDTPATRDNPFPMPYLMTVEEAAERIAQGLRKPGFEIAFPRRFAWQLKFLRMLPYRLYFPLVARVTGWSRK